MSTKMDEAMLREKSLTYCVPKPKPSLDLCLGVLDTDEGGLDQLERSLLGLGRVLPRLNVVTVDHDDSVEIHLGEDTERGGGVGLRGKVQRGERVRSLE